MTRLVFTVGNGMLGDDAAGALLAERMNRQPIAGWQALHGGMMPENVLHQLRELAPEYVLVVDAADMDLPPGSIRLIDDRQLEDPFLITTHSLPLSFLVEALREFVPRVELLGIQPQTVAFGYPVSPGVLQAIDQVYAGLQQGDPNWQQLRPFLQD